MSILSTNELRDLIMSGAIMKHPDTTEDEWHDRLHRTRKGTGIEGVAFELTVNQIRIPRFNSHGAIIGRDSRTTPQYDILPFAKDDWWRLTGGLCLIETMETLNVPNNIRFRIWSKFSLASSGLSIEECSIAPGYKGPLQLAASVSIDMWINIQRGAFVCTLDAVMINEPASTYDGVWGHGRTSVEEERPR